MVASYIGSGFFSNGAQAEAIGETVCMLGQRWSSTRRLAPLYCINTNNFEILVEFGYNAVQCNPSSQYTGNQDHKV